MAKRKKATLPKTELNITSMMDLVLNLLMFFVLVANFSSAELPAIEPPAPKTSAARKDVPRENNVAVSLVPELDAQKKSTGVVKMIKVGASAELLPTEQDRLLQLLQEVKASNTAANDKKKEKDKTEVAIDLRADKSLPYEQVQPVMKAIAAAGIRRFNVVAVPRDED